MHISLNCTGFQVCRDEINISRDIISCQITSCGTMECSPSWLSRLFFRCHACNNHYSRRTRCSIPATSRRPLFYAFLICVGYYKMHTQKNPTMHQSETHMLWLDYFIAPCLYSCTAVTFLFYIFEITLLEAIKEGKEWRAGKYDNGIKILFMKYLKPVLFISLKFLSIKILKVIGTFVSIS